MDHSEAQGFTENAGTKIDLDNLNKIRATFLATFVPVLSKLNSIDTKTNWSVTLAIPTHLEHVLQVHGKISDAISALSKLIYEVENLADQVSASGDKT